MLVESNGSLYWEHIHPYVPLFYKDHFLKQLARDRQNRLTPGTEPTQDFLDQYERRIPYVLLFMIFALAARYEVPDASVEAEALTRVWTAGDEYLVQARELLYLYSIPFQDPSDTRFLHNCLLPCFSSDGVSRSGMHLWVGMLTVGNGISWNMGLFGICCQDGTGSRSPSRSGELDEVVPRSEIQS